MSESQRASLVLLTKIRVPRRRPDILRRARLIEALHQNIHRRLIFVTAPAGFGKTTLLVDFTSEAPGRVCWYHITADDRDVGRFVRYLGWAFRQAYPELEEPLHDLLEGRLPTRSIQGLAGWLNNILAKYVDDFTILVLDDYHLVGEQLEIVDFVEAFLEHLPEQVHLIVASRSVYGIPTTRLLLRNELGVLGPKDLRFTAKELQELAQVAYGVLLPEDYAEDLARRTDGWVIAMLLAVRLRKEGRLLLIRGEREELYTFLAEEVLRHLPEHLVRFLLETSIFDEFNETVCREVLEEPRAASYLAEVEQRNLFVLRVDTPQGEVYRYHQLFAEFLRTRLHQESLQRMQALHRRAADWYWAHGAVEEAVAHRLAAGDREGAAAWMDAAAREMFISGKLESLREWVEVLAQPPDLRSKAPRLLLYQAKVLSNQNRFAESNALLEMARPVLERLGDRLLLANLLITQGFNAYMQQRYAEALPLAQAGAGLLTDLESMGGEVELRRAQAFRVEALAEYHLGNRQQAIEQLETVAESLERLGRAEPEIAVEGKYNLALVLQDLGVFYFQQGRLSDALRVFEQARQLWQEGKLNPVELPVLLNNLAALYLRSGQNDRALQIYVEATEIARQVNSRWLAALLSGMGALYYQEGRREASYKVTQEALKAAQKSKNQKAQAQAMLGLAKLGAEAGRFSAAFGFLRRAAALQGLSQTHPQYLWRAGELYWLLGQTQEAIHTFRQLEEQRGLEKLNAEEKARFALLMAALSEEVGNYSSVHRYLRQALSQVARLGYLHFLRADARRLEKFLERRHREISHPVLAELLALARSAPLPAQISIEEPRWPRLNVRGFGPGEVWKEGALIPRAAWKASGARALFFFILDRGPVRKEDIALAFWPDFSLSQVNSNLHATLWRVRRALGDRRFIQVEQGRYQLHPNLQVEYDVRRFEQRLQRAAGKEGAERLEELAEAVVLYRGDFLADLDFPWVDERRYELQRRYLEALGVLIEAAMSQKNISEAMRWLEPALAADPYNDRWRLYWMQCLIWSGRRNAARAYYQEYRRRLRRELGVEPDKSLQQLAAEL